MNIVILDGISITSDEDLKWDRLEKMGSFRFYGNSTYEECFDRVRDADAIFFSKIHMDRTLIQACRNAKFFCVTATGTDNLDVDAAREQGIACTYVPGYASDAVAQHTIALLLELTNHVGLHNDSVHHDEWTSDKGFCYTKQSMSLLTGKTLGIIGYGNIGRRVARIGAAMGMDIQVYRRHPKTALQADVVSLHIPAAPETIRFINTDRLLQMKHGAMLINTARGTLVDEQAVAAALDNGTLAGYATDVLSQEPPAPDHPLIHHPKAIITPHNAWCPLETRALICDTCADNLQSWMDGGTLNRIDL